MSDEVEWRPIPGFTEYELSSVGDVRNIKTGKVLKKGSGNSVNMHLNGEGRQRHVLILFKDIFPEIALN